MAQIIRGKKGLRFLVVGPDKSVRRMLYKHGHEATSRMNIPWDIVLFTGGPDIVPFLYGEKLLPTTQCNPTRDMEELKLWRLLDPFDSKVGICRGAQLLNVLSGGALWQDVNNHYGHDKVMIHDMVETKTGRILKTTSTHHQMMRPGLGAEILCHAGLSTIKKSDSETIVMETPEKSGADPEVIYYWNTNSLCFQGHPEYSGAPDFTQYFFDEIEARFGKK